MLYFIIHGFKRCINYICEYREKVNFLISSECFYMNIVNLHLFIVDKLWHMKEKKSQMRIADKNYIMSFFYSVISLKRYS